MSPAADPVFLSTLYDMASMARHTEAIYEGIFPLTEDDSYYEYCSVQNLFIEHRLLSFAPITAQEESVRITCILFVNTCLVRGFPRSAAILQNGVRFLRDAVERSLKQDDWKPYQDILFWITFVGAFCTEADAEDRFFFTEFSKLKALLGLSVEEHARTLLASLFYVERIYGERFSELWNAE